MYYNGEGVPKDAAEAARLLRLAANQGDAKAQHHLGVMYHNGDGVAKDEVEAARLLRLAAEKGNANAQRIFDVLYRKGAGVPKDASAVSWIALMIACGLALVAIVGWGYARRDGADRRGRPRSGRVAHALHNQAREPSHSAATQAGCRPAAAKRAAEQLAAVKKEAERTAAAAKQAKRKEAERTEAAAKEAKRKEAERKELAKQEAERKELAKQQAERQARACTPLADSTGHRFDVCCVHAPQRAIALLTQLSELAPSAIIDVLGNADDDVRRAAHTLSQGRTLHAGALVRTACPCRVSATYGTPLRNLS
jgi:hypothetical protein